MTYNFDTNDDNIINLVEKPEEKFIKSPRYQSIHNKKLKNDIIKIKSTHQTLGVPKIWLNLPKNFLKKKSHLKIQKQKIDHIHYQKLNYEHQLPKWTPLKVAVNSYKDELQNIPVHPLKLGRLNFRKQNIKNIKNFNSKPINTKEVYTRHGDKHELNRNGLIPIFIHSKNYGRVPSYLKNNSFVLWLNKHDYKSGEQGTNEKYNYKKFCKYVTQEERDKILKEMKKKWSEIMEQFQCLPFLIDTVSKIKRKIIMEEKLRQIEKDIDFLENNRYIYICDD